MRISSVVHLVCLAAACDPTIYPGGGSFDAGGSDMSAIVRTCTPRHGDKIECPGPEYKAPTGHLGCDYVHDVCADYGMAGGNHYWDMGAEPIGCGDDAIVYGRHFDAIQFPALSGKIRVYEIKTWNWSAADESLRKLKLKQAVEEILKDYDLAKMCGMTYTFLIADRFFEKALLAEQAAGKLPTDPDLFIYYSANCDPKSPLDGDPDR